MLRRKIGIVFQDFQLLMDRSVIRNLFFVMQSTGWKDKSLMEKRATDVLRMVGIEEKANQMPHTLSGGEQQRVAIARALVNKPELILADEPTSALDPISSRKIEEQFKELSQEFSIVLVTHILRQAKRLADYVAFMYLGEIIEKGRPEVIFEDPKTETFKEYLLVGH